MDEKFVEGDLLNIGQGAHDGFYLLVLNSADDPILFPVEGRECVPGDYRRLIHQYVEQSDDFLHDAYWVMFGLVVNYSFFVVEAVDLSEVEYLPYPNLYSVELLHTLPGYYLGVFNTVEKKMHLLMITHDQTDMDFQSLLSSNHSLEKSSQFIVQNKTIVMTGRVSHGYFHVIQQFN